MGKESIPSSSFVSESSYLSCNCLTWLFHLSGMALEALPFGHLSGMAIKALPFGFKEQHSRTVTDGLYNNHNDVNFFFLCGR